MRLELKAVLPRRLLAFDLVESQDALNADYLASKFL